MAVELCSLLAGIIVGVAQGAKPLVTIMPSAKHRTFDDHQHHNHGSELRPYFFQRDTSDLLEEAFETLLRQRVAAPTSSPGDGAYEREVIREQRWTLFGFDDMMQRVFAGDFDAFSAALDDPRRMHERLRDWFRRGDGVSKRTTHGSKSQRPSTWNDRSSPARSWEIGQAHHHDHEESHGPTSLDDDPIYDAAFRWACRTDRWSRRLSVGGHVRDRDLFRVVVNAPLVPAKVAYGFSGTIDDDLAGFEIAAIGYRQAATFLTRTVDSLANCHGKRIGRPQTVHDLMDEGRELLADVESKLAEIDAEIRFRRGKNP